DAAIQLPREMGDRLSSEMTAANLGHEVPERLLFASTVGASEWIVSSNRVTESGHIRNQFAVVPVPAACRAIADTTAYLRTSWTEIESRVQGRLLGLNETE